MNETPFKTFSICNTLLSDAEAREFATDWNCVKDIID